jgi:hypothetical protein
MTAQSLGTQALDLQRVASVADTQIVYPRSPRLLRVAT